MKKTNIKISKLLNAVVLIMEFSIIALLLTILFGIINVIDKLIL